MLLASCFDALIYTEFQLKKRHAGRKTYQQFVVSEILSTFAVPKIMEIK